MSAVDAARLLLGLPAVLVLPGWMWSLAAFPRTRPLSAARTQPLELDLLERLAASFALSVASVSLGALGWSAGLGLPLAGWGSVALVVFVSGAGAVAWWLRVRRLT